MKNIKSVLKTILKYIFLLITGGGIYYGIEILERGRSHWSMFILGGVCFIFLGLLNEVLTWETPLLIQMFMGMLIITALEFITGCYVNIYKGWGVWDYSDMPFNFKGQICLLYCLFWFLLSIIGIMLDDLIRHRFFGEEKPRYKLI